MTSKAGAEDATHIAWLFVREYYHVLHGDPARLHMFYAKNSVAVHGLEGNAADPATGTQAIQKLFAAQGFKEARVVISNVDAQPSADSGILVQVLGELSNAGAISQKFAQTFFLAKQDRGYYVLNDIFRFLREEPESDAEDAPEPISASAAVKPRAVSPASAPVEAPAKKDKSPERPKSPVKQPAAADIKAERPKSPAKPVEAKPASPAPAEKKSEAKKDEPAKREASPKKDRPASPAAKDGAKPTTPAATTAAASTKEQSAKPETATPKKEQQAKDASRAKSPAAATQAQAAESKPAAPPKPATWANMAASAAVKPAPVPAPAAATTQRTQSPATAPAAAPAPEKPESRPASSSTTGASTSTGGLPRDFDKSVFIKLVPGVHDGITETQLSALFPDVKFTRFEIKPNGTGAMGFLESADAAQAAVGKSARWNDRAIYIDARKHPGQFGGRGGSAAGGRGGYQSGGGAGRGGASQGGQQGAQAGRGRGRGGPRA